MHQIQNRIQSMMYDSIKIYIREEFGDYRDEGIYLNLGWLCTPFLRAEQRISMFFDMKKIELNVLTLQRLLD